MHKREKEGINREIEEFLILRERERTSKFSLLTNVCTFARESLERKIGEKVFDR